MNEIYFGYGTWWNIALNGIKHTDFNDNFSQNGATAHLKKQDIPETIGEI